MSPPIPKGLPEKFYNQDTKDLPVFLRVIIDPQFDDKTTAEYVKKFLQGGWSPDTADNDNKSALTYALRYERLEVLKLLLSKGANPLIADKEGMIPLHYATRIGKLYLVKVLVDNNKEQLNVRDNLGWTALTYAARFDHYQCVDYLSDISDLSVRSEIGESLIKLASTYKLKELLLSKMKINAKDRHNMTGLMYAAQEGLPTLVKYRSDQGAKVDTQGPFKMQALHFAAQSIRTKSKSLDTIKILLEAGADPNAKDKYGRTPLYYCIFSDGPDRHYNIAGFILRGIGKLIKKGAQIDLKDNEGYTVMEQVVRLSPRNYIYYFIYLMEQGADTRRVKALSQLHGNYERIKMFLPLELGVYYSIEEFRSYRLPNKGLWYGEKENENCDIGTFGGSKYCPVKVDVSSDELDIEWDRSGSQLYIFCAKELQEWLNTQVPNYRALHNKNPFNNKEIHGVQLLTQAEIDEELAKRNVPKTLKRKRESGESRLEQLKAKLANMEENENNKDKIIFLKRQISVLESLISDSESDSDTDTETDTDDEPAGIDPRSKSSYRLKF